MEPTSPAPDEEVTPAGPVTYLYAIMRKDLSGGPLLAQLGHALTECLGKDDVPLPLDTRIVVLEATKEQLAGVAMLLSKDGIPHRAVLESDCPLEGVITGIGLVTRERERLRPILGELRTWRQPK
jgi:hypothetical protein